MDHNSLLFVKALRAACDRAIEDGRCGTQTNHIEKIEVTDSGALDPPRPALLRVTCYGDYSADESERVYKNVSLVDAMDFVASFIGGRAMYDLDLKELK